MQLSKEPVDVLFICADRVLPLAGGLSARLFALIAYFRSVGFRVGLVVPDHGGVLNGEISLLVDAAWFHRGGRAAASNALQRSPAPVRRVVAGLRKGVAKARIGAREAIPEEFKESIVRPLRAALTGHARGAPKDAPIQSFLKKKISPTFNAFARECAIASNARVVIAEFAWTAGVLEGLPADVLTIVDTHDIQHRRRPNAQSAGHDLPERDCTREEEIQELEKAQVLLAIQQGEAATLREMLPGKRVITAEHALVGFERRPAPPEAKGVLYVGNHYPPNIAGGEAFLDTVWPAIRARVPEARFVVCGKVCEAFRHRKDPGLVLEGVVPSVGVYYHQAAVVVNLVPYGTGLKIKTVEALAHGKCTVVTPAGAEGLRHRPERGLTVCALEDMAEVIAGLLLDPERRMREADGAWAYAQQHLAPAAVYAELTDLVKEHLAR